MTATIEPNSKQTLGDTMIEVSCYGEDMIMVDHPVLPAPLPCGPRDDDGDRDAFWKRDNDERVRAILDYLDQRINWEEAPASVWMSLGEEIDGLRDELKESDE